MKRTPINTWLDDDVSVSAPPPWSNPEVRKKIQIGVGATAALGAVALLIVGVTTLFGGGSDEPDAGAASGDAPSTIETSSGSSVLACQETSSSERTQSSGEGDTNTPEGLIVAYEHAFFASRDAARMTSMSAPSPTVATEQQLADSIKALPVDTPWCVTVAPAAEHDNFDVSVEFVESDGTTITTWEQTMTVTKNPEGQWRIVAVRGR